MSAPAGTASARGVAVGELPEMLRDYMSVTRRLQDTHESLQREVARLRGELESRDRELELRRRLAWLGELAAGVAHEVRNPLGAIQLYSGLLRKECGAAEAALRLIEKIEDGIRAIEGVVQDTLALAPRRGRPRRHRLAEIVEGALDQCRGVLTARGVRVEALSDDPGAAVRGETRALQRVLVNLVANAAEASPAGATVTLHVAGEHDGQIAIHVRDRGEGLSEDVLDRIFDPFFTTKPSGTGLGLTIAHRLVESHAGSLTARNLPTGGAEFTVTLPTGGADGGADAALDEASRFNAA